MATANSGKGNLSFEERALIKRALVLLIASTKRAINTEGDPEVKALRARDLEKQEAFASRVLNHQLDLGE